MGFETVLLGTLYLIVLVHSYPQPVENSFLTKERFEAGRFRLGRPVTLAKKAGPSVGTAPLDINDNVGHTLALVSQLVGTLGGSSSGLAMGLTGVSITDCAGSLKGEDLNTLSCEEFLDTISQCDSLANIKPLLQQAKKKYKKKPNKKAPCFKNKPRKSGG